MHPTSVHVHTCTCWSYQPYQQFSNQSRISSSIFCPNRAQWTEPDLHSALHWLFLHEFPRQTHHTIIYFRARSLQWTWSKPDHPGEFSVTDTIKDVHWSNVKVKTSFVLKYLFPFIGFFTISVIFYCSFFKYNLNLNLFNAIHIYMDFEITNSIFQSICSHAWLHLI